MRTPRHVGHDLDETSGLYVDVHVALECLHMRYPEYIAQTTPRERQLYQLYLALKAAKEEHYHDHAEEAAESQRLANEAINPAYRT